MFSEILVNILNVPVQTLMPTPMRQVTPDESRRPQEAFKCAVCKFSGFTVEFPTLELAKSHLRTDHRATEESSHLSSIILPAKHLIPKQKVNQFARNEVVDDDEVTVLEEIAPPRITSAARKEEEVEVLEEIPPPSFRSKQSVSKDWRVALLNKMRKMRSLPADQLAVHLKKAKEEKKKRKEEEEVLESFRKSVKKRKSRREEE